MAVIPTSRTIKPFARTDNFTTDNSKTVTTFGWHFETDCDTTAYTSNKPLPLPGPNRHERRKMQAERRKAIEKNRKAWKWLRSKMR